jgi:hypothetical protein
LAQINKEQLHRERLDELIRCPRKIGITEPVLWSASEVRIYKPGSIDMSTDMDAFFQTVNRAVCAEYKLNTGHRSDAVRQLDIAYWFVRRHFGVRPECYYVCGPKFEYERVR